LFTHLNAGLSIEPRRTHPLPGQAGADQRIIAWGADLVGLFFFLPFSGCCRPLFKSDQDVSAPPTWLPHDNLLVTVQSRGRCRCTTVIPEG